MARQTCCDVTSQPVPESEVSVIRLEGPIREMIGRPELHLSRPVAAALGRWLGRRDIACPELERLGGADPLDALA